MQAYLIKTGSFSRRNLRNPFPQFLKELMLRLSYFRFEPIVCFGSLQVYRYLKACTKNGRDTACRCRLVRPVLFAISVDCYCANREDCRQTAHLQRLITVFAVFRCYNILFPKMYSSISIYSVRTMRRQLSQPTSPAMCSFSHDSNAHDSAGAVTLVSFHFDGTRYRYGCLCVSVN